MSRKEMIRFLSKQGVYASKKDSTDRLQKKVERCNEKKDRQRFDRICVKVEKRMQRAMSKAASSGGKLPKWVGMILCSDNKGEAVCDRATRLAH